MEPAKFPRYFPEGQEAAFADLVYPVEANPSYYENILAVLPSSFSEFRLADYNANLAVCNEGVELAPALSTLADRQTVEHPSEFDQARPDPAVATLSAMRPTVSALIDATICRDGELSYDAFDDEESGHFILNWHFTFRAYRRGQMDNGHRYAEDAPLTACSIPIEFRPELEDGEVPRDCYSLQFLWDRVSYVLRCERELDVIVDGEDDYDNFCLTKTDSKMACISTQFLRLLLILRVPMEAIDVWYRALPFHRSVANCMDRNFIDSHFCYEPVISAVLFFYRCAKQEIDFKSRGLVEARLLVTRGGIGLSTGRVDKVGEKVKKTRVLVQHLVRSLGLSDQFAECDRIEGHMNRNENLGQFFHPKSYLGSDMWSAILARAFYMLSVFLGRPCGHPLEIAFYNSCHLKLLVSQATSASVIQTGLHSILQFQVTFPAYNLLVTRPQRLADRVFQYSLSRDPVNNFLLYGQAFPQYELTSRHKLASAVLPGLHRLYYGTACLEACRYRIDTPGYDGIRLLTSSAPVLVTIAEQTEYENQLEAIEDMPAIVRCGSHLRDPRNYTEFEKAEDAQASLEIEIRKAQLRI